MGHSNFIGTFIFYIYICVCEYILYGNLKNTPKVLYLSLSYIYIYILLIDKHLIRIVKGFLAELTFLHAQNT